jgi:hypothetical protein
MILAQSFGHSGPSRPMGSSSTYDSAKPPPPVLSKLPLRGSPPGRCASSPIVKRCRHPSTSAAPDFPSPLFLLQAEMGAINGCRLTYCRSSTSRPLRPYKRGATLPANSTVLILAPLFLAPLPECLAH